MEVVDVYMLVMTSMCHIYSHASLFVRNNFLYHCCEYGCNYYCNHCNIDSMPYTQNNLNWTKILLNRSTTKYAYLPEAGPWPREISQGQKWVQVGQRRWPAGDVMHTPRGYMVVSTLTRTKSIFTVSIYVLDSCIWLVRCARVSWWPVNWCDSHTQGVDGGQ